MKLHTLWLGRGMVTMQFGELRQLRLVARVIPVKTISLLRLSGRLFVLLVIRLEHVTDDRREVESLFVPFTKSE